MAKLCGQICPEGTHAAQNDKTIVRYTVDEIDDMARRGQDQTDFDRVRAMTEEELEASIDSREEGEFDWETAQIGIPEPKRASTVHSPDR